MFGYGKYDKVTNELIDNEINYMNDNLENNNHIYMIKMSNVDHIEIE